MGGTSDLLVVDAANVVGSVPDGWWRDRAGAATRLRDALRPVAEHGLPDANPPVRAPVDVVLVVEGAARGVPPVPGVRVVAAEGSGDDKIVELTRTDGRDRRCTVVTADRGLRARVGAFGADVLGPGALPRWSTGGSRRGDDDAVDDDVFPRRRRTNPAVHRGAAGGHEPAPAAQAKTRRPRSRGEAEEPRPPDPEPAGVLFDVDGTLVDTTYLHTVCWWQALRQGGHDVPMVRIHRAIGMGADQILDHLLGRDRDRDGDEALTQAHSALYAQYWERLRPQPGAVDLLRACAARGLRVVLASSASPRELAALRAALGADDVITAATSAGDAGRSKPAPDILEVALTKAGLSARRVVLVGDSVWDVDAAARLHIPCVGLACGGTSAAELSEAGAAAVYADPADLLAALDASPLAKL